MPNLKFQNSYLKASAHLLDQLPPEQLPEVAVVGRSNVGKSTLINHLFRRKGMARSSATPGKTRAIHFFCADDLVLFADLPGYGYAAAPKKEQERWRKLADQYLETREALKLVVFLIDARRDLNEEDRSFLEWLAHKELPFLLVLTKADKLKTGERKKKRLQMEEVTGADPLLTSASKNLGRNELIAAIERSLWGS
jgi:GTP-binding protein